MGELGAATETKLDTKEEKNAKWLTIGCKRRKVIALSVPNHGRNFPRKLENALDPILRFACRGLRPDHSGTTIRAVFDVEQSLGCFLDRVIFETRGNKENRRATAYQPTAKT